MSQPWIGQNYSGLKCHTVTNHSFFEVEKQSVQFGSECKSRKLSQGRSVTVVNCHSGQKVCVRFRQVEVSFGGFVSGQFIPHRCLATGQHSELKTGQIPSRGLSYLNPHWDPYTKVPTLQQRLLTVDYQKCLEMFPANFSYLNAFSRGTLIFCYVINNVVDINNTHTSGYPAIRLFYNL
jgi:hypothetical protein